MAEAIRDLYLKEKARASDPSFTKPGSGYQTPAKVRGQKPLSSPGFVDLAGFSGTPCSDSQQKGRDETYSWEEEEKLRGRVKAAPPASGTPLIQENPGDGNSSYHPTDYFTVLSKCLVFLSGS